MATRVLLLSILVLGSLNLVMSDPTIKFEVHCHDTFLTAKWKLPSTKDHVTYRNMSASFLDTNCNSTDNAMTSMSESSGYYMLNMTTDYDGCDTTITNTSDHFFFNNTAILRVTDVLRGGLTQRDYYYQYDMTCLLSRNISTDTGNSSYIVDKTTVNITDEYNKTTILDFKVSMEFYTDNTFLTAQPGDNFTVNTNEMLYVKIKENVISSHFKFVVNKCEATSSLSSPNNNDVFFDKGCRLDPTFERMGVDNDNDTFRFKIQSFYYGSDTAPSEVYLRCHVYVCDENSEEDLEKCRQTCKTTGARQRRGITPDFQVKEILVVSEKIIFNNQLTCSDVVCPLNSACHNLAPAKCLCDKGFVYSRREKTCKKERLSQISNIHLDQKWNPKFLDTNSQEFMKLALDYEEILYKSFMGAGKTNVIEGVRVIRATKGSVILETQIIYAETSTPEDAYSAFVQSVEAKSLSATTVRRKLKFLTDKTPAVVEIEAQMADLQKLTLIIIIVILLLVILMAGIVIFAIRNRRRQTTKEADVASFDNGGVVIAKYN